MIDGEQLRDLGLHPRDLLFVIGAKLRLIPAHIATGRIGSISDL